jgi:hypothetical protein
MSKTISEVQDRWMPNTTRQKMLGSLVERFTPDQDRADLEALLGPSLETAYFQSTGRDLIYRLGPERETRSLRSALSGFSSGSTILGTFERFEIYTD